RRGGGGARVAVVAPPDDVHRTNAGRVEDGDEGLRRAVGKGKTAGRVVVEAEVRRIDREAAAGRGNIADVEVLDTRLTEEVLERDAGNSAPQPILRLTGTEQPAEGRQAVGKRAQDDLITCLDRRRRLVIPQRALAVRSFRVNHEARIGAVDILE